ncbi:MAG: entericidin A/B family lipoprotein [Burkholderiaceae bacterium]
MKKLALMLIALGVLTGCNTIAGMGQDVQKAGQTVEEAAKKK